MRRYAVRHPARHHEAQRSSSPSPREARQIRKRDRADEDALDIVRLCDHVRVVMEPVPSYEDLVWLFGGEPIRRTTGEPWAYTSATFRTTRAGHDIELDIEPGRSVDSRPIGGS
jgi:hypothetical protein